MRKEETGSTLTVENLQQPVSFHFCFLMLLCVLYGMPYFHIPGLLVMGLACRLTPAHKKLHMVWTTYSHRNTM